MSALDTLRAALFGNPPQPGFKPNREGVLAAFSQLEQLVLSGGFSEGIYETTTAGIAATVNGDLFLVKGSGDSFADLYKNNGGSAVSLNLSLPNISALDTLENSLSVLDDTVNTWQVVFTGPVVIDRQNDKVLYPRFIIMRQDSVYKDVVPFAYGSTTGYFELPLQTGFVSQFHYVDVTLINSGGGPSPLKSIGNGEAKRASPTIVPLGATLDDAYTNFWGAEVQGDGITDLAARDAANLQRSASLKSRIVSNIQTPTAKYNVLILDGQSLAAGQETWPRLSTVQYGGNLMLGSMPFPAANSGNTYPTLGAATLQPLVAQVTGWDHSSILTDSQVSALAPGDSSFGEAPNVGWTNGAKYLLNQHLLMANDVRTYVTIDGGVSGQPISTFLKPSGSWYGRTLDGLTKIKTAAGADTVAVTGVMWMQGEWDYQQQEGGINRKSTYKTSFNKLLNDYDTDYRGVTGQDGNLAIAKFCYQTGASFTIDKDADGNDALAIGMAQLETAIERPDLWMVGPVYPVTDKGGHLDSNGSRWYGNQIAKVYHRVVHLGQEWEPLRPIRIEQIGLRVFIDFHVPEAPLVLDNPYIGSTAQGVATSGFRVSDANGDVPIFQVSLVGQTIVRLDLGRYTVGQVNIWYASQTTGGNGMLRDSDPTVARDKYEYKPGSGMYASANIAALVGKPYPLYNWCVAFFLPVGFGV